MKSQLLRRAAMGAAVLLPLGGMSLIGAQQAGAGLPTTATFAGSGASTVDVDVTAQSLVISVDLSTISDGHATTGSVDLTSGASTYASSIVVSGYGTVTIPAGDLVASSSEVDINGATFAFASGSSFSGCSITGFVGGGIVFDTVSGSALVIDPSPTSVTTSDGLGDSGSCTGKTQLNTDVNGGLSITGEVTVS